MCAFTIKGNQIVILSTSQIIYLNSYTNCSSKEVIYHMSCECQKVYVGMCSRTVRTRIVEHRSKIRNQVIDAPLVANFLEKGHSDSDLKWSMITKLKHPQYHDTDINKALQHLEAFWITNLIQ